MSHRVAHKKKEQNVALVDVLDTLLDKGVVAEGAVSICLADIDLIYLQVQLLATSMSRAASWRQELQVANPDVEPSKEEALYIEKLETAIKKAEAAIPKHIGGSKSEELEKGLARLVLTLVELIRRLMEREAVRQVHAKRLTKVQTQKLGLALKSMAVKMEQLKKTFDLDEDDLNIDLGPLGSLM
jgi:hypothetical protein